MTNEELILERLAADRAKAGGSRPGGKANGKPLPGPGKT